MTRLRLRPARFAAARSGPSIVRSKRKPGATMAYWLSEDATGRFTVQRPRRGRPRIAGAFTHHGRAGANAFMFAGRVAQAPPSRWPLHPRRERDRPRRERGGGGASAVHDRQIGAANGYPDIGGASRSREKRAAAAARAAFPETRSLA